MLMLTDTLDVTTDDEAASVIWQRHTDAFTAGLGGTLPTRCHRVLAADGETAWVWAFPDTFCQTYA